MVILDQLFYYFLQKETDLFIQHTPGYSIHPLCMIIIHSTPPRPPEPRTSWDGTDPLARAVVLGAGPQALGPVSPEQPGLSLMLCPWLSRRRAFCWPLTWFTRKQ